MVFSQKNLTGSCFITKKLWLGTHFFVIPKPIKNAEKNTRGLGRVFFIFLELQKDGFGGLQNSSFGGFLPQTGVQKPPVWAQTGVQKPPVWGVYPLFWVARTPRLGPQIPPIWGQIPLFLGSWDPTRMPRNRGIWGRNDEKVAFLPVLPGPGYTPSQGRKVTQKDTFRGLPWGFGKSGILPFPKGGRMPNWWFGPPGSKTPSNLSYI